MKIALTLLALALAPALAAAQEACDHEEAMSCAEGSAIDPETGVCTPIVTS